MVWWNGYVSLRMENTNWRQCENEYLIGETGKYIWHENHADE